MTILWCVYRNLLSATQTSEPTAMPPVNPDFRLILIAAVMCFLVSGCSSLTGNSLEHRASYPLKSCESPTDAKCLAILFTKDANIAKRDPKNFPQHYLELYDEKLRSDDCKKMESHDGDCEKNLKFVAHYFNPDDKRPDDSKIGIALEGGGTKAGSFGMGILAGLQELGLLETQVGAISSISGGSYAASYYFNRWYDKLDDPTNTSTPDDWFRSCIPDYFIGNHHFDSLRYPALQLNCWEKTKSANGIFKTYNEFDKRYEFIGHVWKNHDLLRGDSPGKLRTPKEIGLREFGNLGLLFGETTLTVPFNFIARTVFRWPLNSAASKLTYKLGLEREYGYSPKDWNAAGSTDLEYLVKSLERRKTRTLQNFKEKLMSNGNKYKIPAWIIGTTAPGSIGLSHWLLPHSRDPLRQQFELTWNGYGSGTYGYAIQPPDAPFDFLGRNPQGLPIVDAVVASAAFFDDDQTQISRQPLRFFAGAGQHLLNITWFTELRNYKKSMEDRLLAKILPWPSYFALMSEADETPYIHLQDGGNTENSGILPLLRRGYKTIIYSHSTEDRAAEWESLCHLKNQLELDGTYFIRSEDLEQLLKEQPILPVKPTGRKFKTHLDELCSSQLNDSDLVTFDENPERKQAEQIPAVAKLYCGRLGYPVRPLNEPDSNYTPCPEFLAKFEQGNGHKIESELFFNWHADNTLHFKVYRGNALDSQQKQTLLSTIITIVPGIAIKDFLGQLVPNKQDVLVKNWKDWCSLDDSVRKQRQIAYCAGPDDKLLSSIGTSIPKVALSCSVMAELLDDNCSDTLGAPQNKPNFPQNNLILETIHTTYTSYAANFDLARHQVRHAICNNPDYPEPKPKKCQMKQ